MTTIPIDSEKNNEASNAGKSSSQMREDKVTDTHLVAADVEKDEEGLLRQYDVILCGTGLVQAILASALARAGQSVLHVDGNDYYGGLEASWTLSYLLSRHDDGNNNREWTHREFRTDTLNESNQRIDVANELDTDTRLVPLHREGSIHSLRFHSIQRAVFPVKVDSLVQTTYGKGRVIDMQPIKNQQCGDNDRYYHLTIDLTAWALADDAYPKFHLNVPSEIVSFDHDSGTPFISNEQYLYQNHQIRTIQAEISVQALDQQSRYFALDVTPYLLYCTGPAVAGLLTSNVAEYCEFRSLEGVLYTSSATGTLSHVPCSKNDIFASKLMSPMDKRRLMKFLQIALDYATAEKLLSEADTVADAAMTAPPATIELQSWNERHLNQGRSLARPQNKAVVNSDLQQLQEMCQSEPSQFENYLRDYQKLSPSLIALVRYALALETEATSSTREGMKHLCAHMLALGRYGVTAFLVPQYGSGEIPQAFCRSAAVYGATYLLRRPPMGVLIHNDQNRVDGILLHGTPIPVPSDDCERDGVMDVKRIQCRHVVVSDGAFLHRHATGQRVLRRISILSGKPLLTEDYQSQQQRHLMILPPGTVPHQTSSIHGLLVDEGSKVAPHIPGGCSVLHLTTTIDSIKNFDTDSAADAVLEAGLHIFLQNSRRQHSKLQDKFLTEVEELFHVTFSYSLYNKDNVADDNDPVGLYVVKRPRPGVSADAAFEVAANIFAKICPNHEFLTTSKAVDTAVRETLGDFVEEEDDENLVLESAVGMIAKEQSHRTRTG